MRALPIFGTILWRHELRDVARVKPESPSLVEVGGRQRGFRKPRGIGFEQKTKHRPILCPRVCGCCRGRRFPRSFTDQVSSGCRRANSTPDTIADSRPGRRTRAQFQHRDARHGPVRIAPIDLDCALRLESEGRVDHHAAFAKHPASGRRCHAHRFRAPGVRSPG